MLAEWIRSQLHAEQIDRLRTMSRDELRRLWDSFDESSFCGEYYCEDVHLVMNEKGDGEYCAV